MTTEITALRSDPTCWLHLFATAVYLDRPTTRMSYLCTRLCCGRPALDVSYLRTAMYSERSTCAQVKREPLCVRCTGSSEYPTPAAARSCVWSSF
jgi:hypothetical protein